MLARLILIGFFCLLGSPTFADDGSSANKLLVEAVQFLQSAKQVYPSVKKILLLKKAQNNLNKIITHHPSSDLAVKLITRQNIGIISLTGISILIKEAKLIAKNVKETGPGYYISLDEFLVELRHGGPKKKFLKMRLSFELEDQLDETHILSVMPQIIDNFRVLLRELRVEELKDSQQLYRVKEELLVRVNAVARPIKVRDVLIGEITLQ